MVVSIVWKFAKKRGDIRASTVFYEEESKEDKNKQSQHVPPYADFYCSIYKWAIITVVSLSASAVALFIPWICLGVLVNATRASAIATYVGSIIGSALFIITTASNVLEEVEKQLRGELLNLGHKSLNKICGPYGIK